MYLKKNEKKEIKAGKTDCLVSQHAEWVKISENIYATVCMTLTIYSDKR